MTPIQRLARVPVVVWAALLAFVVILPGLGSFGFWDPWELTLADRARDIARSGSATDITVGGRYSSTPPLGPFLAATGVRLLGAGELGARLPNAAIALLMLLAVYFAGRALFSERRAAGLSVVVLATMPLFFLQARQLSSDLPLSLGLACALGGLGRFAWPATGNPRLRDLGLGLLGLAIGWLSGGVLLGVALPLLCLGGAVLVSWEGPFSQSPSEQTFGRRLLATGAGRVVLVLSLTGLALLVAAFVFGNVAGQYSVWLGAAPRGTIPKELFTYFVRQLGFGLFPWSALALFALARAFRNDMSQDGRQAFVDAYLLSWASLSFALFTLFVLRTGDARFAALAPLALATGAFLDRLATSVEAGARPVLGLVVAIGTVLIARDIYLAPEELLSVHLLKEIKWPPTLKPGRVFLVSGVLIGTGLYLALAIAGKAPPEISVDHAGKLRRLYVRARTLITASARFGIPVALTAAIWLAVFVNHHIVPELSRHYSYKSVFQSFARFARPGDAFGRFRVEGHGAHFYTEQQMEEIPSQERLVAFFRREGRAFCLVPSGDLAALDAAFKTAAVPYYVLDASSSRFLLLSNRLDSGQDDQNPLKRDVWMAPEPPRQVADPATGAMSYVWPEARPSWKINQPLDVVFQDSVELIGVEMPSEIVRPARIEVVLYFRVRRAPPGGYKIFLHFDIPGHPRFNGDHDPLGGAFPTSYWLAGEYIRDRYEIDVPYMTTPAGSYTVYMGFWPGGDGKRLSITHGTNDGSDRTRLGALQIR